MSTPTGQPPAGALRVNVYPDLHRLPASYARVFGNGGRDGLFDSRPWYENLVRTTLERGARARVYAVEAADGLPRALLVARSPAGHYGFKLNRRWTGRRTLGGMTYQTVRFAPLLAGSGDRRAVFDALARAIRGERPRWTVVDLNALEADSATFHALAGAFRDAGMVVRRYVYTGNWYESVGGMSFEEYLRDRPRVIRKEYPRRMRKLKSRHDVRVEILDDPARIDYGLAIFDRVHSASWKKPEYFAGFNEGLMRACAAMGTLRLGILYVDDEPVAVELMVVSAGEAIFMKGAYDERFKSFSVGSLLLLEMIRHAMTHDRVRELNFGRGDQAYKSRWVSERRELWGLVAFNFGTPAGVLDFNLEWLRERRRALRKTLRPALRPAYVGLRRFAGLR